MICFRQACNQSRVGRGLRFHNGHTPSARGRRGGVNGHPPQVGAGRATVDLDPFLGKTAPAEAGQQARDVVPILTPETGGPIASTTAAASKPRTDSRGSRNTAWILPRRIFASLGLTRAALTRIRT